MIRAGAEAEKNTRNAAVSTRRAVRTKKPFERLFLSKNQKNSQKCMYTFQNENNIRNYIVKMLS